ncbi:hypothetical protein GCM10007920_00210 [Ciceribacter naphthalenivorans]|uniref:Uncharacterized protein n=2 Tax=Alphaproteobacteria TaxID=28211 RepID=A0A512HD39_9HYPH|nr:hypothetical protein RNA01_03010 [Ciceribacter naphthalenivorans]GLR20237.1 hypothetical protein GCM10007920_00210 [Ciceribacter naphthalenivorans]GLT03093.1 hypothetical protein GCM10007926_00210 [Sphingomonas psychrolutea]
MIDENARDGHGVRIVVLRVLRPGAKREYGADAQSIHAEAAPATVGGELSFTYVTEEDASGRRTPAMTRKPGDLPR